MNYYQLLQVDSKASTEVINSAWKVLLKQAGHHPDLGGNTGVAMAINEAHSVLSDPKQRAEYDRALAMEDIHPAYYARRGGYTSGQAYPERETQPAAGEASPPPDKIFIVFCHSCGQQNRVTGEDRLPQARCAACHRKLIPRKDHPFTGKEEASFKLGMYLFEKGLMDRAIREYQSAVRNKPDNANYRYWLGRAFYEKKFFDKALPEFKTAVKLRPTAFQFQFWLGQVLYASKDYAHAAEGFEEALKLRAGHAPCWRRLGTCRYHLHQFPLAVDAMEKAAQHDPSDAHNFRWLGICQMADGKPWEAQTAFEEANRLEPDDPMTLRYLELCRQQPQR